MNPRTALSVAGLLVAWLCAAPAQAATLQEILQQCDSTSAVAREHFDIVELLVLAGSDIDASARDRYKSMAGDAIAWACATGATLEIRAVDSRSREEPYAFSAAAPSPTRERGFNPLILRDKRAAFVYRAWAALDGLYQRPAGQHADFFGAVETAANAANSIHEGARTVIIAVGHGWQQQNPDIYSAGQDPAKTTTSFIGSLRSRRETPDLHGAAVVFVGVSTGPRRMGQSSHLFSLCEEFWLPVISGSKGSWRRCWPEIPAFLRIVA